MREIPLTQGQVALVDDEDFDKLSAYKWCAAFDTTNKVFYAMKREKGTRRLQRMHRFILGVTDPKVFVDHINHNTLDNRKLNLRKCSQEENALNYKIPVTNTSGYIGVTKFKTGSRNWRAQLSIKGSCFYLGLYSSKEEAAVAYNHASRILRGDFAFLNTGIEKEEEILCSIKSYLDSKLSKLKRN